MNHDPEQRADDSVAEPQADDTPALPSIESLDEHSDYRAFMSDKVSEDLRLQALRKLFRLPQFNVCDGLNDYDEDFASCKPLGSIATSDMARGLDRVLEQAGTTDPQSPVATAVPEVEPVRSGAAVETASAQAATEQAVTPDDKDPPAG